METFTQNVIIVQEGGQPRGFILDGAVYGCQRLKSEDIAKFIDTDHGMIARGLKVKVRDAGGAGGREETGKGE